MFKDKNDVRHFLLCNTNVAPSDGLVTALNNAVYFLSITRCSACDNLSQKYFEVYFGL